MLGLGWQELAILLVIVMLIFGAGKLPQVMTSLGQGVKQFKAEANTPVGDGRAESAAESDSARPTAV